MKNAYGGLRAYIHAGPATDGNQLAQIKAGLSTLGIQYVPHVLDGQPVLELREFGSEEELQAVLSRNGWIGVPAVTQPIQGDQANFAEKMRQATLRMSGYLYIVGDIAFNIYAFMERAYFKGKVKATHSDPALSTHAKVAQLEGLKSDIDGSNLKIASGVGYGIGSVVLSLFASHDQSRFEIEKGTRNVASYLRKEGAVIPEDSSATRLRREKNESLGTRIHNFCIQYPSEILNTVYFGVGLLLIGASLKHRNAPKKSWEDAKAFKDRVGSETLDIGLGLVTATSALTGLLVKEKKPVEGEPKRTGLAGIWDWIQEKPLRATGVGYMVATAIHGIVTVKKYMQGVPEVRKTIIGRGVFVAANIGAELLLLVSSKGHGDGVKADASVEKTLIANASELIARQAPDQQDRLIDQLSGYLSSSDLFSDKAEILANQIRTQVASLKQNPWRSNDSRVATFAAPSTAISNVAYQQPLHAEAPLAKNLI